MDAHDQAIRINPQDAEAWYSMGNTLAEQGRSQDALEAYNQAVKIDPQSEIAQKIKGDRWNAPKKKFLKWLGGFMKS